jgi:hypothetical protein
LARTFEGNFSLLFPCSRQKLPCCAVQQNGN